MTDDDFYRRLNAEMVKRSREYDRLGGRLLRWLTDPEHRDRSVTLTAIAGRAVVITATAETPNEQVRTGQASALYQHDGSVEPEGSLLVALQAMLDAAEGPFCVVCGEPVDTRVAIFIRAGGSGVAHAGCEGGLAAVEAEREAGGEQ